MMNFKYRAVDAQGKVQDGIIESATVESASDALAKQGLMPLNVEPTQQKRTQKNAAGRSKKRAKRVNQRDRVLNFTRDLSVMLASGLPLERSLNILDGIADPQSAEMIQHIRNEVRKGRSLGEAFSDRPEFSAFYINMLKAGEASGALEDTLVRLSDYLERAKALRKTIAAAVAYPVILSVVAVLAVVFLLIYVVPNFADLFADMGEQLPLPTQIVMSFSDFFVNWWWVLLAGAVGGFVFLKQLFKRDSVKTALDEKMLRWPLIGDLQRNLEIARFSSTLGVLMQGGVPLLGGLLIAEQTVGNRTLQAEIHEAVDALKEGKSLSNSLLDGGQFPELAVQMMQVGEETGRLEEMLLKVANLYEQEVESVIQRILTLLEPALILIIGLVIAGIILSVLLGMVGINQLVH